MMQERISGRPGAPPLFTDLDTSEVERLNKLLGALRASLMLSETGDVGAFTSDLKAAFFGHLADMAKSAHAIAAHLMDGAERTTSR